MGPENLPVPGGELATKPESFEYLKKVSQLKLDIQRGYLGAWASILGTAYAELAYFDCFAGSGRYSDEDGNELRGSPLQALQVATEFVAKAPGRRVTLGFIERDKFKAQQLQRTLQKASYPPAVAFRVFAADAENLIGQVLATLEKRGKVIPTFFFIDPYGYPLPIPTMRKLLALPKAEILVNLMWFRISLDLGNPQNWGRLDTMFGHQRWRTKHFGMLRGEHREAAFISYFQEEVGARYHVPFPMTYSPEDRVSVPDKRNKYYLIHFSGYHSGALAMKEVMHRVRGKLRKLYSPMEQLAFDYGQPENPLTPLKTALLERFAPGKQLKLLDMRIQTANLPYAKAEYRVALNELKDAGKIDVDRRQSKRHGIDDGDIIRFL